MNASNLHALTGAHVPRAARSISGGRVGSLSPEGLVTVIEGTCSLPPAIEDWTVLQPASLHRETAESGAGRTLSFTSTKSILMTDTPITNVAPRHLQRSTVCLEGWIVLAHPVLTRILKHMLTGVTFLSLHPHRKVMDMEIETLIRNRFVGAVINVSTDFAESLNGKDIDLRILQLYTLMKVSLNKDASNP